jgi:hypothetical protein
MIINGGAVKVSSNWQATASIGRQASRLQANDDWDGISPLSYYRGSALAPEAGNFGA